MLIIAYYWWELSAFQVIELVVLRVIFCDVTHESKTCAVTANNVKHIGRRHWFQKNEDPVHDRNFCREKIALALTIFTGFEFSHGFEFGHR